MSGRRHSPLALFRYWRRSHPNDPVVMFVAAALVGVVTGYAAVGFRLALEGVQVLAFGFGGESVFSQAALLPWWQILLIPAVGGLVVGLMLHFLMPGRRPQAVAHVIEACALKGGRISLREGIGAALVSATSLGVGASTGREGPVVHLAASLASVAAQKMQLGPSMRLTLLGCGVASGVAASFNAPIAGVFFALEVVIGHYALHAFAPVVLSAVVGTIISRIYLGDTPAFIIPPYDIVSNLEFPAFGLLGLVCGIAAMIFMWSTTFTEGVVARSRIPDILLPAAGGLLVGAIAIFYPHVLGVGYEATDAALKEQFSLWLLLQLIVAKTAATTISLGCRFGGGVFSPSLMLGALVGGAFGIMAAAVFPELSASHGAYAIIGMGAVAAAVLGAPISTILIVFELTNDYKITIGVMLATVVATSLTNRITGKSLFHLQLERRGVNVRGGRARHFLRQRRVGEVMTADFEIIHEDATFDEMRTLMMESSHGAFFVVDSDDAYTGTINFADLKAVAREPELAGVVNAKDACHKSPAILSSGQTLEDALAILDNTREEHLPVVRSALTGRVIGVLHHKNALIAHNRALLEAHAEEHDER